MSKRVYFGGAFDPPHLGHLIIGQYVSETLGEPIVFLPTDLPGHKEVRSSFAHRVQMLRLATANNPRFSVDDLEHSLPTPSYTCNTLVHLVSRDGISPNNLHFILGSDSFLELETWHNPGKVIENCTFVVYPRDADAQSTVKNYAASLAIQNLLFCPAPIVQISSTLIRKRIKENRSVRYLIPEPVELYLTDNLLYQEGKPSNNVEETI